MNHRGMGICVLGRELLRAGHDVMFRSITLGVRKGYHPSGGQENTQMFFTKTENQW